MFDESVSHGMPSQSPESKLHSGLFNACRRPRRPERVSDSRRQGTPGCSAGGLGDGLPGSQPAARGEAVVRMVKRLATVTTKMTNTTRGAARTTVLVALLARVIIIMDVSPGFGLGVGKGIL